MIVLIRRADLPNRHDRLEADKIRLHHLGLDTTTLNRAELVVFMEDDKLYVLRATNRPFGKPMSAAELLQYVAKYAEGK
jgi:hypothetical protein